MTNPMIQVEQDDYHGERVVVRFGARQINVSEAHIEWGTPGSGGQDGCDIELRPGGGFSCRFQESSRVLVLDGNGVRIYDDDAENESALIVNLSHDDFFKGLPPKVFDRSDKYTKNA